MMKKPTIKDTAKALNISPPTVSRALSCKSGVSEELRQGIFQKSKEIGYMKNLSAGSLKNFLEFDSYKNVIIIKRA